VDDKLDCAPEIVDPAIEVPKRLGTMLNCDLPEHGWVVKYDSRRDGRGMKVRWYRLNPILGLNHASH
jgi:predicted transcriptional regulator